MTRHRIQEAVIAVVAVAVGAAGPLAASSAVDHAPWDQLLHRYVRQGLVDYRGLQSERAGLDRYLTSLADLDPAQLPSPQAQLAFWINAYNACVMKGVLDASPIKSVKDVKGFFDRLHYRVGGESLTLNAIEAKGRAVGDWRIHFTVVCASSSCPPIRAEAYIPERLQEQLTDQTTRFLSDSRNGWRVDDATLRVSKLFDWYAADFVPPARRRLFSRLTPELLADILQPYLAPEAVRAITARKHVLQFLDYDWTLNAQAR